MCSSAHRPAEELRCAGDIGTDIVGMFKKPAVVDRDELRARCWRNDVVGAVHDVGASEPAVERRRAVHPESVGPRRRNRQASFGSYDLGPCAQDIRE